MLLVSRVFVLLSVLLVLLGSSANDLAAHAALDRSDPPAGAVLLDAPATIRLWFTEPLEARFTRAQLLSAAGEPVAGVSSTIAPDDDQQLVVTLPADLPDGAYTVAWRNLSTADGHTLEGYFGIRVGDGTAPSSATARVAPAGDDTVRALTRALALIGLTALLGIAPVTLGVLDPTARGPRPCRPAGAATPPLRAGGRWGGAARERGGPHCASRDHRSGCRTSDRRR